MLSSAARYGESIAHDYDKQFAPPEPAVGQIEQLVKLASACEVLDIGAGTGRVAIPLARAGCSVTAVDISRSMLDVLSSKLADEPVTCLLTDITREVPRGTFSLAVCLFNTAFMVGERSRQAHLFANTAACLRPGGRMMIEAFLPRLDRFSTSGDSMRVRTVTDDRVVVQFSKHTPALQRIDAQDIQLSTGGIRMYPSTMHYLWPEQMDELAAGAGLELEHRCSDWEWQTPVHAETGTVVSLYRKAAI